MFTLVELFSKYLLQSAARVLGVKIRCDSRLDVGHLRFSSQLHLQPQPVRVMQPERDVASS